MKKYVVLIGILGLTLAFANCGQKSKEEASLIQEIAYENEVMNNVQDGNSVAGLSENAGVINGGIDSMASQTASLDGMVTSNPTSKDIQQALKNAGLYAGKVDGSIGPKSKQAIREFQTQNSLKADGKVGPKTWQKLGAYLNQSVPAAAVAVDASGSAQSATSLGE